jgi:hypothetical protein
MPEKPKSLADELMDLASALGEAYDRYCFARNVTCDKEEVGASAKVKLAAESALRSRLTAIESELNDLRKEREAKDQRDDACDRDVRGWFAMMREQSGLPPRIESHSTLVNGLPCSSELGGESGGTASSGICWDGEDGG